MMKALSFVFALIVALSLSACESDIEHRGRQAKECIANGGEWYNTPGWGEACNFDTRKSQK